MSRISMQSCSAPATFARVPKSGRFHHHCEGATSLCWGRPIQYAHVQSPLALWDVWTPIAGAAFAFEPPSAGFIVDWKTLASIRAHGADFATITHAAGISSTGDDTLDRRLPFDEPYRIPATTARAIRHAKNRGGRIVAIGTTVVRALEHAALIDGTVRAGAGIATQRIGPDTALRVVDAIVSGTHEPGTSHYELLRAFVDDATLLRAATELDARDYQTHEFGDSIFVERRPRCAARTKHAEPLLAA
jgi:S-adenosylmethionine:tRNA ribosyltransferase-isomerase